MTWRRRSESNGVFTDCQPQYPDLQGNFNIDSKGLQEIFGTTRHLPDLTRHAHAAYSVIEEIVEGFVEGFLRRAEAVEAAGIIPPLRIAEIGFAADKRFGLHRLPINKICAAVHHDDQITAAGDVEAKTICPHAEAGITSLRLRI